MADRPSKALTPQEARERASAIVNGAPRDDRNRLALLAAAVALLVVAIVLDRIGDEESKMADHIIDLAKFVLPTLLASEAAIRYGRWRLLCCVMEHGADDSAAR